MIQHELVIGLGSPHGDDAAGWRVVERLAEYYLPQLKLLALREPTQMLTHFANCCRAWIIDASRGTGTVGAITRMEWPADCNTNSVTASSHGWGVAETLRLAAKIERLPRCVILYAIEIGQTSPGSMMTASVAAAIPEVVGRILQEIKCDTVQLPG
jgi:hydrogenase maturation protease